MSNHRNPYSEQRAHEFPLKITLRPFRKEDAEAINTLHEGTIRAINSVHYTSEQIDAWVVELDATYWIHTFEKTNGLVATNHNNDTIIGFGDIVCCKNIAELQRLYVHKNYQGRGVGSALITALEAIAQRQDSIKINVNSSITARPFYVARNYRPWGWIGVPMGRRGEIIVPALFMQKHLS